MRHLLRETRLCGNHNGKFRLKVCQLSSRIFKHAHRIRRMCCHGTPYCFSERPDVEIFCEIFCLDTTVQFPVPRHAATPVSITSTGASKQCQPKQRARDTNVCIQVFRKDASQTLSSMRGNILTLRLTGKYIVARRASVKSLNDGS